MSCWIRPSSHRKKSVPITISRESKYLLVIAHPDDEVMFFSPFLEAVRAQSSQIDILCLSTGNFDGLGETRSAELVRSAAYFDIGKEHVHIVDHQKLQDGMKNNWPSDVIAEYITATLKKTNSDTLVTFDSYGVSGHPNHIAVYKGVRHFCERQLEEEQQQQEHQVGKMKGKGKDKQERDMSVSSSAIVVKKVTAIKLKSKPMFRKFMGPFDIVLSLIFSILLDALLVVGIKTMVSAFRGMYIHKSQNKLYRQIFVVISAFSYINEFESIFE